MWPKQRSINVNTRRPFGVGLVLAVTWGLSAPTQADAQTRSVVLIPGASTGVKTRVFVNHITTGTRRQLEAKVKGAQLSKFNGQFARVFVRGIFAGSARITNGQFKLTRDTANGNSVPTANSGSSVRVELGGVRVWSGNFP
jgi:hypothetical protein